MNRVLHFLDDLAYLLIAVLALLVTVIVILPAAKVYDLFHREPVA